MMRGRGLGLWCEGAGRGKVEFVFFGICWLDTVVCGVFGISVVYYRFRFSSTFCKSW